MAASARKRRGDGLAAESGYTLVELLVVAVLGVFVLGVGTTVLITMVQGQPERSARAAKVGQARSLVESITRDVRQGYGVTAATATRLDVLTWVNRPSCGSTATSSTSIQCKVSYQCTSGTCTRAEVAPNASPSTGLTLISGLTPGDVFSYTPTAASPTWVGVKLIFPGDSADDAITIEDGVALRNAVLGA